jgi:hypothetical protein
MNTRAFAEPQKSHRADRRRRRLVLVAIVAIGSDTCALYKTVASTGLRTKFAKAREADLRSNIGLMSRDARAVRSL